MVNPFQVGDWLADPPGNALSRGGEVVRIEPRAMDLLVILVQHAGTVVSREELFRVGWPGVVVGDEALTQVMAKLRKALGDDPRAPTYIETIAKRGYRLVAPVTAPWLPAKRPTRRAILITIVAMVAIAGIAATAFLLRERPAEVAAKSDVEMGSDWTTVTVLPFEYIGSDGSQAYLARGIGDGLMTELGQLSGLRVINPSGVVHGEAEKRARYVVSGSVQREGNTLRIHARLVDGRSGEQLWAVRFERPFGELFPVQDEIIRKLAQTLPATVSASERSRLAHRHTRSLEAYDHFLRAQVLFLARGARENAEARAEYLKAVELDPRFARAYAGLALTHAMDHRLQANPGERASLDRALELAESAREIDPDIAEVHWALGFVHAQAKRHREAIAALERAIELNPSFADAYALLGGVYTYIGEPARSIAPLRMALRLKPDGGYLVYLLLGRAYFFQGDLEQAMVNLKEAVARNPSDLEVHLFLAASQQALGNGAAAAWELDEVRTLDRSFSLDTWLESYPLSSPPLRAALRKPLEDALNAKTR